MNILLLKQVAILSAIFGAGMGILTLIPFVNGFCFMALMLFAATIVLIYMKKHDLIGVLNVKEGAILGAEIGFVSFIGFAILFIPLVSIIGLIFKGYNTYGILYLLKLSGFFVLIMLIIFLALMSSLMNAFSGLMTISAYEYLLGIKKEENEHVNFEIKE